MINFSNLENIKNYLKEDFVYSEITALVYFNPSFFDFLKDEKWKYLTNNNVFNNSINFEFQRWNIIINNRNIVNIIVEKDWDFLKKCFDTGILLRERIAVSDNIIVDHKSLTFNINNESIIFRDKNIEDWITSTDLEKLLGKSVESLYSKLIDSLISIFISHIKNYLKPDYLLGLDYFLDIFFEKRMEINWINYSEFKLNNLGFRKDDMPKLYYNNLLDYCNDLFYIKNAFRDYELMMDTWKSIKNNTLNKDYLLNIFKQSIVKEEYKEILAKYYSLSDKDYYKLSNNDSLIHLPTKLEFMIKFDGDVDIKFKSNDDKDMVICFSWGNIEMRIKVGFGIIPNKFYYNLVVIENKNIKNME